MSDTRHHRGTLTKVSNPDKLTGEEMMKAILAAEEIEIESYYANVAECFADELRDRYFYHAGTDIVYELDDNEVDPYDDTIHAQRVDENTVSYELRFYDGGTYFTECLGEAVDNLVRREKGNE